MENGTYINNWGQFTDILKVDGDCLSLSTISKNGREIVWDNVNIVDIGNYGTRISYGKGSSIPLTDKNGKLNTNFWEKDG